MNPLFDFTYLLRKYKFQIRYIPRILVYYFKFAIYEPLRIYEKYFIRPKLSKLEFDNGPIFILGYYRSGTTHLQEVLLQDKKFGYLNFYQTYFSSAFIALSKILKPLTNFIIRSVNYYHPAHNIPFHMDLPGEEDVAMVSSGYRHASNWGQLFPDNFKDFFNETVFFTNKDSQKFNHFKDEYDYLVKRLQYVQQDKTLLLKSPPNTARISFLKDLYPNAKFIYIRRNPYYVYKSNLKLWKSFEGQHLCRPSANTVEDNIFWSYKKCLKYYEDQKKNLEENEIVEVVYEEFLNDPIGELSKIYQKLQLDGFSENRKNFLSYIDKKHGKNRDNYSFTDRELKKIQNNLGEWISKWNYQKPKS